MLPRALGVAEGRLHPEAGEVLAQRRRRHPGARVVGARPCHVPGARVVVGEAVDEHVGGVVDVDLVAAAEVDDVAADHVDGLVESPGGAERGGRDLAQDHRLTGSDAAEGGDVEELSRRDDIASAVGVGPAGHVDGCAADVGELEELRAVVGPLGDPDVTGPGGVRGGGKAENGENRGARG